MLFDKTKKGKWLDSEERTVFDGGGSIVIHGYRCPFCKCFNNRKRGKENFCHDCGADLREGVTT